MNKTKRMVITATMLVALVGGSAFALNSNSKATKIETKTPNVSEDIKSNQIDNKKTLQKLDNKVTTNSNKNVDNKNKVTKQENDKKDTSKVTNSKNKELKEVNKEVNSDKGSKPVVSNKTNKVIKTTEKKPVVRKVSQKKVTYNRVTRNECNNNSYSEEREMHKELQRLIDEDIENSRKNFKRTDETKNIKQRPFSFAIVGKDKNGHDIVDLDKVEQHYKKNKKH